MNNLVQSLSPKFTKLQVLKLRQDTPQLQDAAVEMISNYCHDLQDLDLGKNFKLTDYSLYALVRGCLNLIRLNISGCLAFSDNVVAYLARSCRKLKFLNLCGCVRAATDTALKAIGYYCNQLQSVNLGWCEKISDAGVISLADGCPRALHLCGCILITETSGDQLQHSGAAAKKPSFHSTPPRQNCNHKSKKWAAKQVNKSNFPEALEEIKSHIANSDFVAVSLQNTGGFSSP